MLRPRSFAIPPRPSPFLCNDAFISSLSSSIPHRPCICPRRLKPAVFFYFAVCIICPDASRPSIYASNRGRSSLRPVAFISFRCSPSSLHHSLRLCFSFRASRRQSASASLAFPYLPWLPLRIFALDTGWFTRLFLSTSNCAMPVSLRSFPLFGLIFRSSHISLTVRRHCCHSMLSFQNFPLSTLCSEIGYTFSSGRVLFRLSRRTVCLSLSTSPFLVYELFKATANAYLSDMVVDIMYIRNDFSQTWMQFFL